MGTWLWTVGRAVGVVLCSDTEEASGVLFFIWTACLGQYLVQLGGSQTQTEGFASLCALASQQCAPGGFSSAAPLPASPFTPPSSPPPNTTSSAFGQSPNKDAAIYSVTGQVPGRQWRVGCRWSLPATGSSPSFSLMLEVFPNPNSPQHPKCIFCSPTPSIPPWNWPLCLTPLPHCLVISKSFFETQLKYSLWNISDSFRPS